MFHPLILVLSLAAPHVDEIDNPEYMRWSRFKAGTSVVVKTVSETHKLEMTSTTTLKSVDNKEIVLETVTAMVVAGKEMEQPAQSRKVPAKIKKAAAKGDAKKPESGKETLEIAGKKLACTWTKTLLRVGESETTSTVWMCDHVPGGLVKMESETTSATKTESKVVMKMTQDLVSYVVK